jgi:hypothetical protein
MGEHTTMHYIPMDRIVRTGFIVLLVILVVIVAGCTSLSPEIVGPETRVTMAGSPQLNNCFFLVNNSAHSSNSGTSQQITVTGYVSNTCTQPMENLVVRGTFYNRDGRVFATADDYVGHIGYNGTAGFTLSVDTQYTDLYTFRLQPGFRNPEKLF